MRRASDLFGLPVRDAEERSWGCIHEILVDLVRGELVALVIPVKVLSDPGLVPVDKTLILGADEVRLAGKDVMDSEVAEELRRDKLTLEQVRKLTVVTDSDNRLGNVEDLVLEGHHIVALELSDGLIQDVFQGRETINWPGPAKFKEDKIIVPQGTWCQRKRLPGTWQRDQGF